MHEIDIVDVINYIHCPMYQKFSHNSNIKNDVVSTLERFDSEMHQTIYTYLKLMQKGEKVNLKILNSIFAKTWIGTEKTIEDILFVEPVSWRDTYEQKRKKGLISLNKFNKFLSKDDFCPLLVDHKYKVQINKNITLTGSIEFVRELNNSAIELIDFKVDDKMHNKVYVEKDIEITAAAYAFEKNFNKKLDSIIFYGLDKNKVVHTSRNEEDYKMLKLIVINVYKAIYNKIYYPAIGDKCNSCMYKSICINSLNYKNMV